MFIGFIIGSIMAILFSLYRIEIQLEKKNALLEKQNGK